VTHPGRSSLVRICTGCLDTISPIVKSKAMVNDVATLSTPLVSLVEKEELEEAPLDVNVF